MAACEVKAGDLRERLPRASKNFRAAFSSIPALAAADARLLARPNSSLSLLQCQLEAIQALPFRKARIGHPFPPKSGNSNCRGSTARQKDGKMCMEYKMFDTPI